MESINVITKCLIIAAGQGSRLKSKGGIKPLVDLLGLSLIERAIHSTIKAGISDFYIVTGYKGAIVRNFLDSLTFEKSIRLIHIINDDWERGNGISVLKAKGIIKEKFLLLMCDHIFDYTILTNVINKCDFNFDVTLVVDYNLKNEDVDMDDVTKVLVVDGTILSIGKTIVKFNAYDTGIFICSPSIFNALEESSKNSDDSLTGGIHLLAAQKSVGGVDILNKYWIDVDNLTTFNKAVALLLLSTRNIKDGIVSSKINRFISIKITKELIRTKINPNQITIFNFILCIISAILFSMGSIITLITAGIIVQLVSILDGCDGEIARLKFKDTKIGEWLDYTLDRYGEAIILAGLCYHVTIINNQAIYLWFGILLIIGTVINDYLMEIFQKAAKIGLLKENKLVISRDVRLFVIFIGSVSIVPIFTVAFLSVVLNIKNLYNIFNLLIKKNINN